MHSIIRCAIVW